MTNLSDLIVKCNASAKALQSAATDHKALLISVSTAVKPVFLEYIKRFGPLAEEADRLGTSIPEVYDETIGQWGNMGLTRISNVEDGFFCLSTTDCFRNETDYREAYIPRQYLSDGGPELMRIDALRIDEELKAFRERLEIEATEGKEIRERAELERLSSIYGR